MQDVTEKNVLVVHDVDFVLFFVLPYEVYKEYAELLDGAHNNFAGGMSRTPSTDFVEVAFTEKEEVEMWVAGGFTSSHPEHFGVLHQYAVDSKTPIEAPIVKVLYTGAL